MVIILTHRYKLKHRINTLYLCRTHSLHKGCANLVEFCGVSDDANLRAGTALVGPAVLGPGLRNVQVAYDVAVDHLIGARSEGWSQDDIKCIV